MPYKLIKPLASTGKMRVTPEQSEVLQNELFMMGYSHRLYDSIMIFLGTAVYWTEIKKMEVSKYGNLYDAVKYPEHNFNEHFTNINQA